MNHFGPHSIFYIDSQNRTSGTSGNFSINLNMPPNNTYNRIVVMQASIPKSFYLLAHLTTHLLSMSPVHRLAAQHGVHLAA